VGLRVLVVDRNRACRRSQPQSHLSSVVGELVDGSFWVGLVPLDLVDRDQPVVGEALDDRVQIRRCPTLITSSLCQALIRRSCVRV